MFAQKFFQKNKFLQCDIIKEMRMIYKESGIYSLSTHDQRPVTIKSLKNIFIVSGHYRKYDDC